MFTAKAHAVFVAVKQIEQLEVRTAIVYTNCLSLVSPLNPEKKHKNHVLVSLICMAYRKKTACCSSVLGAITLRDARKRVGESAGFIRPPKQCQYICSDLFFTWPEASRETKAPGLFAENIATHTRTHTRTRTHEVNCLLSSQKSVTGRHYRAKKGHAVPHDTLIRFFWWQSIIAWET